MSELEKALYVWVRVLEILQEKAEENRAGIAYAKNRITELTPTIFDREGGPVQTPFPTPGESDG